MISFREACLALKEKIPIDGGMASRFAPRRAPHALRAPESSERYPVLTTYSKLSSNRGLSQKLERFYCRVQKVPRIRQNEERQQMHVSIGIPIVMDYEKYNGNFGDFSSL